MQQFSEATKDRWLVVDVDLEDSSDPALPQAPPGVQDHGGQAVVGKTQILECIAAGNLSRATKGEETYRPRSVSSLLIRLRAIFEVRYAD